MKKYVVLFVMIMACSAGYSQKSNVDALFREFDRMEKSEEVKLSKIKMSLSGLSTETLGVDDLEMYVFDNPPTQVKEELANAFRRLKDSQYETVVSSNEEGSRTKVLLKLVDDTIREVVVFTTGNTNVLVRLTGKIRRSDIDEVTQKYGKGGC